MTLSLALALLASAKALAGEPSFPAEGDRWLLDVRSAPSGGQGRFARVRAEPDARSGWATHVICGTVDIRTGRETIALRADGVAARARGGWLGGTFPAPTSTGTGGFTVLSQDGLDARVEMSAPCQGGHGQFSSGD
ncbi:hypothetical protein MEX01_35010 [Methylorubrum extorquens]|uniref:hypothetical protein n=2 Tax=Methylobacteriaceae TaxID=119045 RepID=UPI00116A1748|nr:hypothetical protein [Methylorubrum extorquens]GEL42910.1 hypothetical protein MEX01_35010 [Methylorubrum extorquens]